MDHMILSLMDYVPEMSLVDHAYPAVRSISLASCGAEGYLGVNLTASHDRLRVSLAFRFL